MAVLICATILFSQVLSIGVFSLEASSYQLDVVNPATSSSLLEHFEKEASKLEQDLLRPTDMTTKENCGGNYNEIINKISLLATKLNTSLSVELSEKWSSETQIVLDQDGTVIFVTQNDTNSVPKEEISQEFGAEYKKSVTLKVNPKLIVKFGILAEDGVAKSVQNKSFLNYLLLNEALMQFFSNIWFAFKVISAVVIVYVLEML